MPPPEHYRLLDRLCLDLYKLIDEQTRLSNHDEARHIERLKRYEVGWALSL